MADLGYRVRWTAWDLELPEGARSSPRPLPDGLRAPRRRPPPTARPCWTLVEDAFLEWSERDRGTRSTTGGALVWGRPGFEPWNLRLLETPSGEVVGAVHVHLAGDSGYVARVAVRPDHRGRGLARALLVDAFALAREHGAVRSYLRPTPGPARAASTSGSGWSSPPPG